MKKFFFTIMLTLATATAMAADTDGEGLTYFLPKTQVKFIFMIEKTSFTPGEYAGYAKRFLKSDAKSEKEMTYRILKTTMLATSVPDSAKRHVVPIDRKHSIFSIDLQDGVLRAVNTKSKPQRQEMENFVPSPKKTQPNVRDFMNEDMLNAGNEAKLAQLMAQEIYDIRDSRNQLSRGEADYMPKDGEQLKIMLANLDTQEKAFRQAFMGYEERDTMQQVVTFTPSKNVKQAMLCRFSTHYGLTDSDNPVGTPVYINTDDLDIMPELATDAATDKKKDKEDVCLYINLPGKIRLTLVRDGKSLGAFETYAAQFGEERSLSGEMFGKKNLTRLTVDTVTGNVIELKTEPVE